MQELIQKINASNLDPADKAKVLELFTITNKHARELSTAQLRRARELAGLSLGQAAERLRIARHALENIELGKWRASSWILLAMDDVYGLGIDPDENDRHL